MGIGEKMISTELLSTPLLFSVLHQLGYGDSHAHQKLEVDTALKILHWHFSTEKGCAIVFQQTKDR